MSLCNQRHSDTAMTRRYCVAQGPACCRCCICGTYPVHVYELGCTILVQDLSDQHSLTCCWCCCSNPTPATNCFSRGKCFSVSHVTANVGFLCTICGANVKLLMVAPPLRVSAAKRSLSKTSELCWSITEAHCQVLCEVLLCLKAVVGCLETP